MEFDIANIVVTRFSLRMSEEWLHRAYGDEANRADWLAFRARLFRDTLYRSLKAQVVPPKKLILLMDEGDRVMFESSLAFDPSLIEPIFVAGRRGAGQVATAISRIATSNVAISRIDSDDLVAENYLQAVNDSILRAQAQKLQFDFVIAPHGYRSNGRKVQNIYYPRSPFLTLFCRCYMGEDIYGFKHESAVEKSYVVSRSAHWMQVIHHTNIGNQFLEHPLHKDQFDALVAVLDGRPGVIGTEPETAATWPVGFTRIRFPDTDP